MDKPRTKYIVQYNVGENSDGSPSWYDSSPQHDFDFDTDDYKSEQRAWRAAKAYLAYEEGQEEDEKFKFPYRIVRREINDEVEDHS